MKLKLCPSLANDVNQPAGAGSVQIPFFPHRRVSRKTALWAITVGVWPVLIYKIFSAGARERREARLAKNSLRVEPFQ